MYLVPESLLPFFQWCDATRIGVAVRESLWLFPAVEAVHLLALAALGGTVLVVDMRLWGLGLRRQPLGQLARDVFPWLLGSLAVMLATGILLFLSEPLKYYANLPFQVKMIFLFFAIIFTLTIRQQAVTRTEGHLSPVLGKTVALASLVLWSGVGMSGRAIGFW